MRFWTVFGQPNAIVGEEAGIVAFEYLYYAHYGHSFKDYAQANFRSSKKLTLADLVSHSKVRLELKENGTY